ncbi:lytic murein transglycosylase, partial [Cellulomonas triticagri]
PGPAAETRPAPTAPTPSATPPSATPRPTASASPQAAATRSTGDRVDADWLARTAERSGIPPVALRAYAGAALALGEEQPGCGIGWNTLAAIGLAESDHGTAGGSALDARGVAVPPVLGPALDGSAGRARIADTDAGALDGDTRLDRAVGPMQMIPQTWATWAADGDGDGVADPQNVTDAALAAARYLCVSGDLADPEIWVQAVASYNDDLAYNNAVADEAERLAGLG